MEQHYVGLDVGLEETSLCIVDSEGKTVREVKVSTEPAAIRSALEGYADRLSRVGVEASSLGLWLYRELHAVGLPIIVVEEARHMRVSLSTDAQQNRPKQCARYCTDVAAGQVPRCPCEGHRDARDAHALDQPQVFSSASWSTSRIISAARCEPTDCWSAPSAAGNMKRACAS